MGSIYRRGSVWWIKYYRNGRSFRETSGSSKESIARRLLRLREGDVARGLPVTPQLHRITFNELADDMVTDFKVNKRRSLRDLEMRLDRHLRPFFGNVRIAQLTTSQINRFIAKRQEEGASNGEINRELSHLKRALNLGAQAGKVLHRPHVPMLKENNVRSGFFDGPELRRLEDHLPEEVRPVIRFAYITGWRIPSEVLTLQWRQVDFEGGFVVLEAGRTKNDEARIFPLLAPLRELLEERRRTAEASRKRGILSPWVFHRRGKPIRDFRRSWRTACRNAGLGALVADPRGVLVWKGRIPHDLRRSAVRNLVRAGVPERVAMKLTGHKTRSVFERYNIVNETDLSLAAERLGQFLTGTISGTVEPEQVVSPASQGEVP